MASSSSKCLGEAKGLSSGWGYDGTVRLVLPANDGKSVKGATGSIFHVLNCSLWLVLASNLANDKDGCCGGLPLAGIILGKLVCPGYASL